MGKLKITKKKLLTEYKALTDKIADFNEDKSIFSGEEVCIYVISIVEDVDGKAPMTWKQLYKLYDKKVKSLKLAKGEWVKKYGVPQIIDLIYNILNEDSNGKK